ncbi:MAG: ATP-binding cassette domain-containing protein [Bacteroidetes bacterium]|jgi:ABC-type multidrug transport system ATPase subunit|nr:ATP-binding cassette domain-containing protein [Bacteroidota bacterium]
MLLQGKDIHFQFGDEIIFRDFSFHVREGEHVVLKGESGSGKSTLFQLILGFEKPDEGTLLYRNQPLTGSTLKEFRKQTAWLPQDLNIGSGSTLEVLQYPLEFKSGGRSNPDRSRIVSLLHDLNLNEDLLEKPFGDLSTGQRQRMGIILCVLLDKPILLLDEPTSALDSESKERLAKMISSQKGKTILSTSHDDFWVDLGDKIVEMPHG